MSRKTLKEITTQRDNLYQIIQERRSLGAFDTNAGAILAGLEATLAILNHLISEESEK